MRLTFDFLWLWNYVQFKATVEWHPDPKEQESTLSSIKSIMEHLRTFDKEMQKYGDFCVFDIFNSGDGCSTKVYRLGNNCGELQPSCDQNDLFRRIIFCEGLSLVHEVAENHALSALPYLVLNRQDDPIERATRRHLTCSRQEGSEMANPYSKVSIGFHITFYEVLGKEGALDSYVEWKAKEKWNVGYLYEKSGDLNKTDSVFRQSAFTVFATSKCLEGAPAVNQQEAFEQYWTLLLLTPSGFFQRPKNGQDQFIIDWKNEKELSKPSAELTFISHALKEVAKRWTHLHDEIERLLIEDFMDPKKYVRSIFDDESLTRSRLYFWVIGCLNEFLVSIEDNIKQWKLFREARVTPLLKHLPKSGDKSQNMDSTSRYSLPELERLQSLDQSTEGIRETLESLRSRFTTKLETVKALRDGLFNASALIESRASTKLGENVKLLTYVSIFYLPLAFCAALWAIPNVNQGSTRNPLIITAIIVGFVTYVIVFNLGNLAELSGRMYYNWRANLVKAMQKDSSEHSEHWRELGLRFEEFRPNNDRKRPSEWCMVLYQMLMLTRKREVDSQSRPNEV